MDEVEFLYALVEVSTAVVLGQEVCAIAEITPEIGDANPSDNIAEDCQVVIGSWDPNDKQNTPDGEIALDQVLTYLIRFQNVGTAEAVDIVLRDSVDGVNPKVS